jgi:uncharacterized protein (TIGR02246 family)
MRALTILMTLLLPVHLPAQSTADETALRERIAAHERASAANDLRGLVDVYSVDAEMIAANGAITKGRPAIEEFYRRQITGEPAKSGRHHTHPADGIRIRFVSPDVALIDLPSRSIGGRGADGQPLAASEITLITVWRKIDNQWLVVSQRALPGARPPRA